MTEEELMEALRQAAQKRAERELDPAWDRLARGELTAEERAALEQTDEHLATLFAPMDEDFVDGIVDELFPVTEPPAEVPPLPERSPTPAANTPSRWLLYLAPVAVLAAALLLFFAIPAPRGTTLPEYSFEVTGGDQVLRGDPAAPASVLELSPGSRLQLAARPPADVDETVQATVFVQSGSSLEPATPVPQVAASGAVRWTGTVGAPPLVAGAERVILVVYPLGTPQSEVREAAVKGAGLPMHAVPVSIAP